MAREVESQIFRRSKDRVVNARGRFLLNLVSDIEGNILNDVETGDKEGEFTCVNARGCSVM